MTLHPAQEIDGQLAEGQAPIDALEDQRKQFQTELNASISKALGVLQDVNRNSDQLEQSNKGIER